MAMEKSQLKKLGVLLAFMLVIGFALVGQGLASGDTAPPNQAGPQASGTVAGQVYGAVANPAGASAQPEQNAQQAGTVAAQVYDRPDQIVLSWTADPQTTQTVAWRAEGAAAGKVQYMKESDKTGDFSGAQEKDAVCSELYTGFNHFEAELDNLQPGTTYAYRAGADGCWSEPATFTTAASTGSFSFMFMGDAHAGYYDTSAGVWQQLLAQARASYPDIKFALQAGDLVDDAGEPGQWSQLFSAAAGVFDRIPLMTAPGNHESEHPDLYYKSFALPQNGPAGLEEHHYSFDYGNAHIVVLDSNLMGNEGATYEAGINWLENDLQSSSKKWKFVMFHHPPYGVSSADAERADMIKEKWVPVLERDGVDMVFVGHQHVYMRTYPINGLTYVLGNAGNKCYVNPEEHDYVAKIIDGEDSTGYTVINIEGEALTMTTMDAGGNVVDEYKMNKSSDMNASVSVSSVKLLNSSYQSINSVPAQGDFYLQAHLNNNSGEGQTALAVLQARGGEDSAAECGGEILGIVSMQAYVPEAGADVYAGFTLPDGIAAGNKVFVDVYVLNDANVPIDKPYQKFSFDITS